MMHVPRSMKQYYLLAIHRVSYMRICSLETKSKLYVAVL